MLGVVDLDLYLPQLNFVFGLADLPGRGAVIALPDYARASMVDAMMRRCFSRGRLKRPCMSWDTLTVWDIAAIGVA